MEVREKTWDGPAICKKLKETAGWAGRQVCFLEEVDSTNTAAKELAKAGAAHGTLVVTENQTQGKGRRGHSWTAQKGENIMATMLLRPRFAPQHASMLTLVMGLSVAQACGEFGILAQIKWPNDAVVNGKKICGILTEMGCSAEKIDYVIIGFGINVNQKAYDGDIAETATSLYLETGKEYVRTEVLAAVIKRFEENYETFTKTRDLSGLQKAYEELLVNKGRQVKLLDGQNAYLAVAEGVSAQGELLIKLEDGSQKAIRSGEVSVRGVYGYV